jgi:hypothetical protein
MKPNQKGFSVLLAILIAAAVALAGAGTYVYVTQIATPKSTATIKKDQQKTEDLAPAPTGSSAVTVLPPQPANQTADWQTYRNEDYGFEIKYPSQYSMVGGLITFSATKRIRIDTEYCCFPIPQPNKQETLIINGVTFQKISGEIVKTGIITGVLSYRTAQNKKQKEIQIVLIEDLGEVSIGSDPGTSAEIYDITKEAEAKILDEMLSTFKLIEPTDDACSLLLNGIDNMIQNLPDFPLNCDLNIGKGFENWMMSIPANQKSALVMEIFDGDKRLVQKIPIREGDDYLCDKECPSGLVGFELNMADDVNFDGYKDLKVLNSLGPADVEIMSYDYWVFDSAEKKFKKFINIINPVFDKDKKIITSHVGVTNACFSDPNCNSAGTTTIYEFINGTYQKISQ